MPRHRAFEMLRPARSTTAPMGGAVEGPRATPTVAPGLGNRAIGELLHAQGRDALDERVAFRARPPGTLPLETPAWTEDARVHVTPRFLLLPSETRQRVLRHERVHALHQRAAPARDAASSEGRARAESEAARGEAGGATTLDLTGPAPARLAHPPTAIAPWDMATVGFNGIVAEVVDGGVTVRTYLTYAELGVTATDTLQTPYAVYGCTGTATADVAATAKNMRAIAKKAAAMNKKMSAKATWEPVTMALVLSAPLGTSAYRQANGHGLLMIDISDFAHTATLADTVAHESSHGIFESHNPHDEAGGVTSDAFAQAVAALFLELKATHRVPDPKAKFDPSSPPSVTLEGEDGGVPAGLAMVKDVLWSGAGGHPTNVDEFFASAYAAYVQQPKLLATIIAYYAKKADSSIRPLGARLLKLLAAVGDPKKLAAVKAPKTTTDADAELAAILPTPDEGLRTASPMGAILKWLLDPTTLPSPKVVCP